MGKRFIFTVTTGRSGTSYLTRLLADNLVDAEVHHERLGYQSFGVDTPDASHFTLFNSVGNVAQVQSFWRQKLARVAKTTASTYAEISHFNAKAGLIENLDVLREHGDVHIILLRRDPLATLRSFHNRHDFANLGFTWLFALDPRYPNKIVTRRRRDAAGAAYWYVQEMTARAAYYRRLIAELPGVFTHECDLSDIAEEPGARDLLRRLGVALKPELVLPKPENATAAWQLDQTAEDLLTEIVRQYDSDCAALGEAFYDSGRRLSAPETSRTQTKTVVISRAGASVTEKAGEAVPLFGGFSGQKQLLEVLANNKQPSAATLEKLGTALYYEGDVEGALERLRAAYEIDPACGSVRATLATVLVRNGDADQALRFAREAVDAKPDDVPAWLAIGKAHNLQGNPALAIDALERALAVDEYNTIVLTALNRNCFDAGRLEEALTFGQRALLAKDAVSAEAFPELVERFNLRLNTEAANDSGRNVVAFTLWGNAPIYTEGMLHNADLAREFYSGWECRLYHDGSVPPALVDQLTNRHVRCIRVGASQERLMGTFWRFLVSDSPDLHRFVCRDADARIGEREQAAVAAWEQSGKPFHIMRDHPHHIDLMLAGMWGGTAGVLPKLEPIAKALYADQTYRWHDQTFLRRVVWPLVREHSLIHDSDYSLFGAVPYPIKRPENSWQHIGGGEPAGRSDFLALPEPTELTAHDNALIQARKLVAQNDHAAARPILEDLVRKAPTDVAVIELLGASLYFIGDLDGAHERLAAAHAIDPDYGSVRTNLAATLIRLDRSNEALDHATTATKISPDSAQAWLLLGNARGAIGQSDEAIAALERALAIENDNVEALSALNKICFDAGRIDIALDYGKRALRSKDTHFCNAFHNIDGRFALHHKFNPSAAHSSGVNVIAFTLWGDKPIYTEGMIQNARLAKDLYPGWECRLYHDGSVEFALLKRLADLDVACHRVDPSQQHLMGTFWRFLASDDPSVHRFVCRDADARLSERERAAVASWEESDKPFHVMRDHPIHIDLILAGLWGGVAGALPRLEPIAAELYGGQAHRWHDQEFLSRVVWPLIRDEALIHDSDYDLFGAVPFPIPRPGGSWRHIGGAVPVRTQTIMVKTKGRSDRS